MSSWIAVCTSCGRVPATPDGLTFTSRRAAEVTARGHNLAHHSGQKFAREAPVAPLRLCAACGRWLEETWPSNICYTCRTWTDEGGG